MKTAMLAAPLSASDEVIAASAQKSADAPPKRRMNPLASTRVQSMLLLVTLLGSWEGAVRFFNVPRHLVPPFSDVAVALWRGLATGPMAKDGFWYHGGVTLAEIVLGFGIGSGVGLAIGIVVSQMPRLEALLEPYVAALQSVPKVAVAPIIVVWLGLASAPRW
jgi:NitT/TauT family transport system permease protein